jgi:hypothetical protein
LIKRREGSVGMKDKNIYKKKLLLSALARQFCHPCDRGIRLVFFE